MTAKMRLPDAGESDADKAIAIGMVEYVCSGIIIAVGGRD